MQPSADSEERRSNLARSLVRRFLPKAHFNRRLQASTAVVEFVNRPSARPVSFVGLQLTHKSAEPVQPSVGLEADTQ
ncbi:hypothetical protein L914_04211, partial [Phytophthora nicotianae]